MGSRRTFIQTAIPEAGGLVDASRLLGKDRPDASGRPNASTPVPVITPDVKNLPLTMDNGVKVFRLIAEPVKRKTAPWKTIDCWGFNGSCPGPTIQVNHGDRGPITPENHLSESTALHWHGLQITYSLGSLSYLFQKPTAPRPH